MQWKMTMVWKIKVIFTTVNFDILFDILEDETFCQEIQETDSFIEDVGFYNKLSEYS